MNCASFGSISHGALRTEDLLTEFSHELNYRVRRNADAWSSDDGREERDRLLRLVHEANETTECDTEEASELVDELQEALDQFAPPYGYFGSHPGDGSDFGYWLSDCWSEDFDGLKVDDTSEVPADYSGEVMHVSDHGNLTLYVADHGELKEIWGIV